MSKKNYKNCAVPMCQVTTFKNPDKLFFSSPTDTVKRTAWLKAMRRNLCDLSAKTNFFVCEDHFDLEKDLENSVRVQFYKGNKKQKPLNENVIPHRFDCQPDKSIEVYSRNYPAKRRRLQLIDEIVQLDTNAVETIHNEDEHQGDIENPHSFNDMPSCDERPTLRDKSVQANLRKPYRSIGIQHYEPQNIVYTPIESFQTASDNISTTTSSDSEDNENDVSLFKESNTESDFDEESVLNSLKSAEVATSFCKNKSKFYIGIPQNCFMLVDVLKKKLKCSERDIFIVLQKIRLNNSFDEIADKFGIKVYAVSRIFSRLVPKIFLCLDTFVFWPPPETIKLWLPIPFRMNYNQVQCIIDCMEIEIEKPANPVLQTLTWSEYKKANTIKYLVAITPNGFFLYVSAGFGGRTSDMEIIKSSTFLQKLPAGCVVMADRGFKGIDTMLHASGCQLVRPPSVSASEKLSKEEAIKAKVVASLRVHIERGIRRLREFKMLKPHSCVNHNLIKYLDHVIIIATALSNLQRPLIKFE